VETVFKLPGPRLVEEDLDVVVVERRPVGVKLVKKEYREVAYAEPGGRVVVVRVPVFKLCGVLEVGEREREALMVRTVTRGVYISASLEEVEALYTAVVSALRSVAEWYKGEGAEALLAYSVDLLYDLLHYAVHLLLNLAAEAGGMRLDDFEHYVSISVDEEEAARAFVESLLRGGEPPGVLPLRFEVVVANEVDLLKRVRWVEAAERLEEARRVAQSDAAGSLWPLLEAPRCFHTPRMAEGGGRLELRAAVEAASLILRRVVERLGHGVPQTGA